MTRWDSRVSVYFQDKAWADTRQCVHWMRRDFGPAGGTQRRKFLTLDNLKGQIAESFVTATSDYNSQLCFFEPNITDLAQPIDDRIGMMMKNKVVRPVCCLPIFLSPH